MWLLTLSGSGGSCNPKRGGNEFCRHWESHQCTGWKGEKNKLKQCSRSCCSPSLCPFLLKWLVSVVTVNVCVSGRLVKMSWQWRTWTEELSPSATAACLAPCSGRPSSTHLSLPFWACTASLTSLWQSVARLVLSVFTTGTKTSRWSFLLVSVYTFRTTSMFLLHKVTFSLTLASRVSALCLIVFFFFFLK